MGESLEVDFPPLREKPLQHIGAQEKAVQPFAELPFLKEDFKVLLVLGPLGADGFFQVGVFA